MEVGGARAAWKAWSVSLSEGARAGDPRRELALAPVIEARPGAQELVIRVPPNSVEVDTPVTHHGVLLGFLRPWKRRGEKVESEGLARVALLGHPSARPVAAMWKLTEAAPAVHFLLTSGEKGPTVAHASHASHPLPGQLAWTRDVSSLGDPLPGGLLVGRVSPGTAGDVPGGGQAKRLGRTAQAGSARDERLEPIFDISTLGYVVIEIKVGAEQPCRRVESRALASASRRGRLRLDKGRLSGLEVGDVVVQDGVLVGRVVSVGPASAEVWRDLPPGRVLVVAPDGEMVSTTCHARDWPRGWMPEPGWRVVVGHRSEGGILAGTVADVSPEGFALELPFVQPDDTVQVLER